MKLTRRQEKRNSMCSDQDAAIALFEKTSKPKLTQSLFVLQLNYREPAEGYWDCAIWRQ